MSSNEFCMKYFYQIVRDHPEIPCNCPISILRRYPEFSCDCIFCDCEDCALEKECGLKIIESVGLESFDLEQNSSCTQIGHHAIVEVEACDDVKDDVSDDSFFSLEICEDDVSESRFHTLRRVFWCIGAYLRRVTTSWLFWCCLFLLAMVLAIGSFFLKFIGIDNDIIENTESTSVTWSTISTTTIKTTTRDDFPTPVSSDFL